MVCQKGVCRRTGKPLIFCRYCLPPGVVAKPHGFHTLRLSFRITLGKGQMRFACSLEGHPDDCPKQTLRSGMENLNRDYSLFENPVPVDYFTSE